MKLAGANWVAELKPCRTYNAKRLGHVDVHITMIIKSGSVERPRAVIASWDPKNSDWSPSSGRVMHERYRDIFHAIADAIRKNGNGERI